MDWNKPIVWVYKGANRPARVLSTDVVGKWPVVVAVAAVDGSDAESIYSCGTDGFFLGERWFTNIPERSSRFFAFYKKWDTKSPYILDGYSNREGFPTLERAIEINKTNSGGVCPIIEIITEEGVVVDTVFHPGKGSLA